MVYGCQHVYKTIFLYPYIIKACCPGNGKGIVLGKYPSCVSYKNLLHKSKMFLDAFKKGSVPKSCRDCLMSLIILIGHRSMMSKSTHFTFQIGSIVMQIAFIV